LKKILMIFLVCLLMSVGCQSKKNEDKQYKISFKVDGIEKTYFTGKGDLETGPDVFEWIWMMDPTDGYVNGSLHLKVWNTPQAGVTFQTEDSIEKNYVDMAYGDEGEPDTWYFVDDDVGDGTLTFIDWEGPGGFARGIFSGTFEEIDDEAEIPKTVTITEGSFEIFIPPNKG